MQIVRKRGSTSNVLRFTLRDALTGAGATGLSTATNGLAVSTIADVEASATAYSGSNLETIVTLGTFAAPTSGKCRFREVDATNHPGLYEVQLADSRFAVANARVLRITISGAANVMPTDVDVQLTAADVDDATALGLSRLDVAVSSRSSHSAADVWAAGTRTLSGFGFSVTVGTNNDKSGYSLASAPATAAEIADAVLARSVATVEGTMPEHCLGTVILATLEGSIDATTWTIKRTNGSTTHTTKTVTRSALDAVASVT